MQYGILFDNILIASNEKKAEDAAASASSDVLSDFQKKVFDVLYKIVDIPFLEAYKNQIIDVIEKAEKQPILTIGDLVSIIVVVATAILRLLFGRKKPQAPASPTTELRTWKQCLVKFSQGTLPPSVSSPLHHLRQPIARVEGHRDRHIHPLMLTAAWLMEPRRNQGVARMKATAISTTMATPVHPYTNHQ
ncbi:hypothetical protein OPV22_026833 [Ensete ventricosum]|uniref:Uncharacterized protein n=1 Tax=Ensete ventricosum TaxID=4639 RepID=A0AAV8P3L7_ENSVE|nr:hypothetical protein OPV22_026833 [Ensete ventricosum]